MTFCRMSGSLAIRLTLLGSALALGALPALAKSREPAPIVYAGQGAGGSESQPRTAVAAPSNSSASKAERAAKRIEFSYPGQPAAAGRSRVSPAPSPGPAPLVDTQPQAPTRQQFAALPQAPVTTPAATEYSLAGQTVRPAGGQTYDEIGLASWYGPDFHGKPTANGETFDQNALTAAHPSLPLPSLVHVTNMENGREVVVRVNDRGPFVEGRMIDLSLSAASQLGFAVAGEARVRVRYLGPAPVVTPARTGIQEAALSAVPVPEVQPTPGVYELAQPRQTLPVGTVYVQLGAFANISNAERLSRALDSAQQVYIRPTRVNGSDFFRVWVGPFASQAEARRTVDDLARRGFPLGILVEDR